MIFDDEKRPHPFKGNATDLEILKSKKLRSLITLTDAQKHQLYPSPSWADNREVRMPFLQLQQALNGNFMSKTITDQ